MAIHPEPYVKLPTTSHKTTLILLHGTSQTGPRFAQSFLATQFSPPCPSLTSSSTFQVAHEKVTFPEYYPSCKFVFPTGAPRKTTVFDGRETNAWFDIADFGDRTKGETEMIEGIRESSLYLADLIRNEIRLINGEKTGGGEVFLVGFSQGSAVGLMLLLSGELHRRGVEYGFGGFIGLSGWLPFRRQMEKIIWRKLDGHLEGRPACDAITTKREDTVAYVRKLLRLVTAGDQWSPDPNSWNVPLLLGHGEMDVKVNLEWGLQLNDTLGELEMDVEFKVYAGLEHWWNEQEVKDVAEFLGSKWHDTK
ncbi:hypothetical protein IFR05_000333 [Cadophora sp. M221]|nr:hypothetical protein IFR05_000333 [Cadophora sp. M221]